MPLLLYYNPEYKSFTFLLLAYLVILEKAFKVLSGRIKVSSGITQCYLPPGRGDIPTLPQLKLGLGLATLEGCKAELAVYIPRWYTRPKMVTYPGTNRAHRGLTSFVR